MMFISTLILFIAFVSLSASAQAERDAAQTTDDLRTQLLEVQAKEAELQARVRQIDEELKPENIERSLAGIGSTRPEELRELRRRQLSIEKESVLTQLKLVATSRERLQFVIATAETQAYQRSAEGTPPITQALKSNNVAAPAWQIGTLAGAVAVLAVFAVVVFRKLSPR